MNLVCKHCGNKVTIKSDKCPYCEKPLPISKAGKNVITTGCFFIILICIVGALYFLFYKNKDLLRDLIPQSSETTPTEQTKKASAARKNTPTEEYLALQKALQESDVLGVRKYISSAKLEEMESQNTSSIIDELTPDFEMKNQKLAGEQVKNNRAVLVVLAEAEGFTNQDGTPAEAIGIVRMLNENGRWKVFDQKWHINPPSDPAPSALEWLDIQESSSAAANFNAEECLAGIATADTKEVKRCLQNGMTPETPWNEYGTAYDFALLNISRGSSEDLAILLAFLDAGADVNQSRRGGMTPLMMAASFCKPEIAEALIARGANIHLKGENGFDAAWAAQNCPEVQQIVRGSQ